MLQAAREENRKIASRYSADDIKARDAKFMVGIQQLKGMYLQQLRRIKAKYGTYLTQMHPEDFLSKAGMSFYDDFAIAQDMEQLIENDKNGLIFDYENNAEDREFKLLAKYYFDAFNVVSSYCGAMQMMDSPDFQPEFMEMNMQSSESYAQNAMEREGQIDGPGFSPEEYAAYVNRVKKRFKWGKKNKAKRFGRFK